MAYKEYICTKCGTVYQYCGKECTRKCPKCKNKGATTKKVQEAIKKLNESDDRHKSIVI